MNFSTVNNSPDWSNRTVYIIGGGPSLKDFDFKHFKGFTIGVNDAAIKLKTNVLFSMDHLWIQNRPDEANAFKGEKFFAVSPSWKIKDFRIPSGTFLERRRGDGLSIDPGIIHGQESGFGAFNLAVLKKARRIVLMGLDMHYEGSDKPHWHDGYPWGSSEHTLYANWAKRFDLAARQCLAEDILVINASESSKITCFTKVSIESFMER